ncbi:class I SAM-dependent methyltransferase [Natronosporangium hydrolyticum]|uniref:Class I SAM-dependent methyltransferase n=1 Tax=Natronosporangium hydrolyticum TaxID=2811111 RepID=A0A895YS63_9ACTN|nr:class I SAM-dependent methyltransferase [Natronosporangium hydrolyticum]QSB16858.1 class I SAM-dependent methyltransferase [Natronosporangium hydrolyticum]
MNGWQGPQLDAGPQSFWEKLHRNLTATARPPNPRLVEIAESLSPGVALDLGCGGGGDAIWLAGRGWRVTAVDISGTAVARVEAKAGELGLGDQVTGERHDLAHSFPTGTFDLVNAQYFHTPFALDRGRVLASAARALRPGGLLLVVDHGSKAPWSWNQDPDAHYPTPDEVATGLDLEPGQWQVLRADMPQRLATGPGGQRATVTDNLLLIQRREDPAASRPDGGDLSA